MTRQKTGSHITGQGKSFIGAARSFGCDESEERERLKRIRDAAREHETDNDPASFERAFAAVAKGGRKPDRKDGAPRGEAKQTKETR
jgi:hypothetical protein